MFPVSLEAAHDDHPRCQNREGLATFVAAHGPAQQRAGTDSQERWVSIGKAEAFESGRVHSATVGTVTVALVRTGDGWRALNGTCPHQGGPLTEGTVCDGAIRCPWHGYDFSLENGKGIGNDDAVDVVEVRERESTVELLVPQPTRSSWTVSHVVAETMVEWGVDTVFGMVGHSNLGLAEALRV